MMNKENIVVSVDAYTITLPQPLLEPISINITGPRTVTITTQPNATLTVVPNALIDVARAVVGWDWINNDEDCVRDMDALRKMLDALPK